MVYYQVWPRWCRPRLLFCVNALPQISHIYGFSLVWTRWCEFRFVIYAKRLWHVLHWHGLSPVWTRWCCSRVAFCANPLWHVPHTWCLSPVWIRWWLFKLLFCLNSLSHISQTNDLSTALTFCILLTEIENLSFSSSTSSSRLLFENWKYTKLPVLILSDSHSYFAAMRKVCLGSISILIADNQFVELYCTYFSIFVSWITSVSKCRLVRKILKQFKPGEHGQPIYHVYQVCFLANN